MVFEEQSKEGEAARERALVARLRQFIEDSDLSFYKIASRVGTSGGILKHQAMPASTEDGAAGKNFETQRGWLFVNAGPGNNARHESTNGERWLGLLWNNP